MESFYEEKTRGIIIRARVRLHEYREIVPRRKQPLQLSSTNKLISNLPIFVFLDLRLKLNLSMKQGHT